ncbi:hypothetical protein JHK84_041458 [Glycine max]|nr:hypothetical protein JHK86_041250 [Glycine max]KAG5115345.1 hypothetical protein JHK84_041458 [Glycine max]
MRVTSMRCQCHQAWQKKKRKMTRVSKLVNRVLDKYEKLPASLKDHINLEEMLGMKMKRSVETQNTTSRGPQHPINEKLERFKSKGNQYNSSHNCTPYPTTKKRLILSKRVYSTRTRGRSGPLQSLALKLGRFKVRAVIVDDIASEESNRKR